MAAQRAHARRFGGCEGTQIGPKWWFGNFLVNFRPEIWLPIGVLMVPCAFAGCATARKGTGNHENTTW
jgi:hypothetical protein